jgi:hypothetical protein
MFREFERGLATAIACDAESAIACLQTAREATARSQ